MRRRLQNEYELKNEDDLKMKMTSKIKTTSKMKTTSRLYIDEAHRALNIFPLRLQYDLCRPSLSKTKSKKKSCVSTYLLIPSNYAV